MPGGGGIEGEIEWSRERGGRKRGSGDRERGRRMRLINFLRN
jgi:hypothetical protein